MLGRNKPGGTFPPAIRAPPGVKRLVPQILQEPIGHRHLGARPEVGRRPAVFVGPAGKRRGRPIAKLPADAFDLLRRSARVAGRRHGHGDLSFFRVLVGKNVQAGLVYRRHVDRLMAAPRRKARGDSGIHSGNVGSAGNACSIAHWSPSRLVAGGANGVAFGLAQT